MRLIHILSLASAFALSAQPAHAARSRNAEPAPITLEDLKGLDPNEAIELIERAPNSRFVNLDDLNWSKEKKAPVLKAAEEARADQDSLWGDTILEGDYQLTGDVEVSSIEAIFVGSHLYGYKVSVWASAEMDIGEDEPTTGSISAAVLLTRKLDIERIDNWIAEFND
jgi:hypothetical protein